jgi:hypothetical protein
MTSLDKTKAMVFVTIVVIKIIGPKDARIEKSTKKVEATNTIKNDLG